VGRFGIFRGTLMCSPKSDTNPGAARLFFLFSSAAMVVRKDNMAGILRS